MDKIVAAFNWVVAHYAEIISAVVAVLSGLIALFTLIPGEQPEKALQAVVDFIAKFSKKPEAPKAE